MHILPVLDVLHAQVVRGIAGRREEYRPIVSRLTPSAAPLDVARAFRAHFGLSLLYLADLDAILGGCPALPLLESLKADGFRLWVDAGLRQPEDVASLARAEVEGIIAGLETLHGPAALEKLLELAGPEHLIFSLDLKQGIPLGHSQAWEAENPIDLAATAWRMGVQRLILLDLARVGTGTGTGTEELSAELIRRHPDLHVIVGGGIAGAADLHRLKDRGVWGALVASALHDGRLTAADLAWC
jgi:phosphoribosylformimino-5-aminoimidazole carboxamide ribotide isomerase